MLLFLSFCFSTLFTFGIVFFLFRPTAEQKAVGRRLAGVKVPQGAPEAQELDLYLKTLQRGSFGWLEDLASGSAITKKIQNLILQADASTTPGTVMMSCLGTFVVVAGIAYLFTGLALIALPGGLVAGYVPMLILSVKKARRMSAFNNALPECIDMMGRSLRAGHSMVAAIAIIAEQAVEPAKTEWGEVYKKQNYGLPFREALMQMLERVPSQDLRVVITGILVQRDTGGNLAEILDRILHVIKERQRIQGEIRIHTAQGRMTGWILCALPIVMLGLINMVNPGYSKVLFTDPFGRKMLYGGVALLSFGSFLIRQIVNGIEV